MTIYFLAFSFGEQDRIEYWERMKQADPRHAESSQPPYTAKQNHQSVHKDIWFNHADQRLQMRLYSADTELVLEHHDNLTEIIEQMQDVTCYMQEELFYVLPDGREVSLQPDGKLVLRHKSSKEEESYVVVTDEPLLPMQVIRHLEAENAVYHYQTDRFVANDVAVSRFVAAGHELLDSLHDLVPIVSGIAQKVEFSLAGSDFKFQAHQLKATFHQAKSPKK
ncbi:MAG: hypothetical protein H0X51_04370 [Parachlamydiaceae bacterium]|nr:hypothetical protein [Parachlamydiaceae bacterium]